MWIRTVDDTLINLNFFSLIKVVRVHYGGMNAPVARWEVRAYRLDSDKHGQVLIQASTEDEAKNKIQELYTMLNGALRDDSPSPVPMCEKM